jgi:DNA-directed RNA polymerase subunit RPC12/RpoP
VFCQNCGKEIVEGQVFCQHCGIKLIAESRTLGVTQPESGRYKTPWEDRLTNGFFGGLFKTVKDVILSPSAFFKKMPVTGGLTDPLLFAMIIGTVGLMFLSIWDLLLHDTMRGLMTNEMTAAGQGVSNGITSPLGTLMVPFLLIIWLFAVSGMLHFFLMIVRGDKAGFEATFRVVSYSVSPFLFMVIPYCGMLVTMIWVLSVAMIGLRDAHETTGGKATVAVLFPFLVCCGMLILAAVMFMGAIASSFGAMIHMYK